MVNLDLTQFEGAVYDEAKVAEYMEKYASVLDGIDDVDKEKYAKAFEQIMIAYVNNKEEYRRCEMMDTLILDVYKALNEDMDINEFMAAAKKVWAPKFFFMPLRHIKNEKNEPNMENHLIQMTARRIKMLFHKPMLPFQKKN